MRSTRETTRRAARPRRSSRARGVALMIAARSGMAVGEYAARLVKKAVVGTGSAEKPQVHAMVARGLEATPMAALTRARAGTVGRSLVVNLPGSPKGATENLEAIVDLFPHILQLLEGDNGHH